MRVILFLCFALAAAHAFLKLPAKYAHLDEATAWAKFYHEGVQLLKESKEPTSDWLKTCAGWSALGLCSAVFGSGIDEETARNEDLDLLLGFFAESRVNYAEQSVTSACRIDFENSTSLDYKAIFRPHLGCTLVERLSEAEIRAQRTGDVAPPPPLSRSVPWPRGEGPPVSDASDVDMACVRRVVDRQFTNTAANTRGIVIVFREQLIHEQYSRAVTRDSRLLAWSVTKTVTGALTGITTAAAGLDVTLPVTAAMVPEWHEDANDPRRAITLDNMLRMSSGTLWGEGVMDVIMTTQVLYYSNGNGARAAGRLPLVEPINSRWEYNSGSTYLLSRIANEFRARRDHTEFEFAKRALFWPIGAHSMYIEHDASKNFLGGALGYGTARDWARFGLLWQRDGVWIDGTRVLPSGWVSYATRGSSTNARYGAHIGVGTRRGLRQYSMSGFRNQHVYVFPAAQIVIVRFSMPLLINLGAYDADAFQNDLLQCFTLPASAFNSTA